MKSLAASIFILALITTANSQWEDDYGLETVGLPSPPIIPAGTQFNIRDYGSTVTTANCSFPAQNDAAQPPVPAGVPQPCEPPTFQYEIAQWVSATEFNLTVMHSVRNGTDPVQVKSCSVPAGKGGNILCRTDEMPAPAGWQGDAVIGNDEPY